MPPINIRPSARPLAYACPSSIIPPEYQIDRPTEARSLGIAAHALARLEVLEEEYTVAGLANTHGCDVAELEAIQQKVWGIVKKLSPYLGRPFTEYRVSGPLGSGTIDLLADLDDCHVVADYKSGWVRVDARPQLMAYAHALRRAGRTKPFKIIPIHLRYGTYDVYDVTDADFTAFEEKDREIHQTAGTVYNPGDHCGYCRRSHDCAALLDASRNAGASLSTMAPAEVSAQDLVALYPKAQMLKKALALYNDSLRRLAAEGPLVGEDGSKVELQEISRDDIDPKKAWPVLKDAEFDDDDLKSVLSVNKGSLVDIVKKRSARGTKQREADALVAKLRTAGAIVTHPYRKLKFTKPPAE